MEGKSNQKSRSFFNLMAGNVPDGGSLWESIQKNEFPKGEFLPLAAATDTLKKWYQALFLPHGKGVFVAAEKPGSSVCAWRK